jgi:hypothetical protein
MTRRPVSVILDIENIDSDVLPDQLMITSLRRRRSRLAAGGQPLRVRRRAGHPSVVRRHGASWEFACVWHLEPSLTDPDAVYAGVEDAALFRSTDGGAVWHELAGLRGHGSGPAWQPGASNPDRIFVAISAAGALRTDDGTTWKPINNGLITSIGIPDPHAEVGHCVDRLAHHRSRTQDAGPNRGSGVTLSVRTSKLAEAKRSGRSQSPALRRALQTPGILVEAAHVAEDPECARSGGVFDGGSLTRRCGRILVIHTFFGIMNW